MALPAALHGEAAKTSGRADEMLEDRRRHQQEHHPQAASSQGTARNRRACRAGRVRVRLSRPNQQAPMPNSSAATASLPPSDICAGIRLPSKAMKNTSALGLNRLVATPRSQGPRGDGGSAPSSRPGWPSPRRSQARSAPTPSQARYSAPSACRMANSTGVRLSSSDTPVSTRVVCRRIPQASPSALARPARRPWCRDVRTTRATSGPGLTRAMANTAARVSKTDNSCMATPRKGIGKENANQRWRRRAGGNP